MTTNQTVSFEEQFNKIPNYDMTTNETETLEEHFHKIPVPILIVMRLCVVVIVLLNSAVMLCLSLFKHKIPKVYTIQILCLCVCDVIVGVAMLLVSITDYMWIRESVFRCSFVMGFFLSTQSNTLYNVMAICINRFISLVRIRTVSGTSLLTKSRVILLSVSALVISFGLCYLPFQFWSADQSEFNGRYEGCSMDAVFLHNRRAAVLVFVTCIFAPLMVTNLLYGCLLFTLKRMERRKVSPNLDPNSQNANAPKDSSFKSDRPKNQSNKNTTNTYLGNAIELHETVRASTSKDNNGAKPNLNNDDKTGEPSNIPQWRRSSNSTTTTINRQTHQKRAFSLLGLVLIFLNIFTWPAVIVLLMETNNVSGWSLDRGSKISMFCLVSINSIVNPVLYTIRLAEFRKIVRQTFLPCKASRSG